MHDRGNHQQESNIRAQVIFFRIKGENHQQESRIRVQVISFGRLSATRVVALESRGTISVESVFCCLDCRVHLLFPYITFQTVKSITIVQRSTQQNRVSLSYVLEAVFYCVDLYVSSKMCDVAVGLFLCRCSVFFSVSRDTLAYLALCRFILYSMQFRVSIREGVKKIDFFLGKSPKLWVGGGQES